MKPDDLENYLSQIARVMKPGGRAIISYFLINDESAKLIKNGKSSIEIKFNQGKYFTADPNNLEGATGYDEEAIMKLYKNNGLAMFKPIQYGSWSGRKNYLSYQDLVIGVKN
jgi:ubiquinone/menaquinone biosynthesis C-methylase UbiE